MPVDRGSGRAKEFWEGTEGRWQTPRPEHWLQHPAVQRRLNILTTGNSGWDRYGIFVQNRFPESNGDPPRPQLLLTLGCGRGDFERGFAQYRLGTIIHEAIDISEQAIAEAARLAQEAGFTHIRYRTADLNTVKLPPNTYSVVFGISSVHHVAKLEHLFTQVARSLKPGGYFLLDEFVGPSQFQWTDEQLEIVNAELARLPEEYRRHVSTGVLKERVVRPTIAEMNAGDPSEAVRSAEILPLLPVYFDVMDVKGYGGTLLNLLLEGICGNFDENDAVAMKRLQSFFTLEDAMIASGRLQHDFAHILARKRATVAGERG